MPKLSLDEMRDKGAPALKEGTNYVLQLPMPCIGSANQNIDIASDYAWALFAIEELRPHVKHLSSSGLTDTHPYSLEIRFCPGNTALCRTALERIISLFDEEQPDEAEDVRISAIEFEDALADTPVIAVPDLGDSFLANYVHGLVQVVDDDQMEVQFARFPTWRFGYWKSFLSHKLGKPVFASTEGWILPFDLDITFLLRTLGWSTAESKIVLQPAQLLRSGSRPWILVNDAQCLFVPVATLNTAAACWHFGIRQDRPESTALTFEFGESPPGDYLSVHNQSEWVVSSDGSIVIVRFRDVQILTFLEGSASLRPDQTAAYLASARDTYGALAKHCHIDDSVDWTLLTADIFEELCYEILVRCERFDPMRLRKVGNTRSRDGGRDIEAWTHAQPGRPAEKWICQCKFSSNRKASLTGLKTGIADVVDQFGANGYVVMTNMLIDATLYDKLDGIKQTRTRVGLNFDFQTFSRLEIERFVHASIDLYSRFFQNSTREIRC